MKLDQFEKMIRKIVREEIEYSMEKLISNRKTESKDYSTEKSLKNESLLREFAKTMEDEHSHTHQMDGYEDAPDYLKNALTRDYSNLVKRFNK
jgi:thiamine phosphate synthase YjbQ (UPF0047 family)